MTKLTLVALPVRYCSSTFSIKAALMLSAAVATAPTAAFAEAHVRGSPEAVTVEAKDTSVKEILGALSSAFDLHYRSSANLETRLTGSYEGSLRTVMKRVLEGYSYFAKVEDGGIDLTVLDIPRTVPAAGASPAFRIVAQLADATSAPRSLALAAVEPSVIPAFPAVPSTGALPPPGSVGRVESDIPAQPSPAIAIVEPPASPVSPTAPSSRERNHLVVAGGTESRPSPPRRIKTASDFHHGKKSKYHVRRTSLARSSIFCSRPIRALGQPITTPVSSYYWNPQGTSRLRSSDWSGAGINSKPEGSKTGCQSKRLRAIVALQARSTHR